MTITDMQALTEVQRDALREVANIGAGHAATALSTMTGTKIMISVPTITVCALAELAPVIAEADELIALVPMEMSGSLHGHTILAFPLPTAHRLAGLMLRRDALAASVLSELEASALTEAGNILAGAYMTALSEFMRMTLLPSPPTLSVGPARDVLTGTALETGHLGGFVFCVETEFMIDHADGRLPGYFLLLPDSGSLGAMLTAVRVA
ncbi:MAG TPA: chemotaxis protein CheC [Candidatus Elarobacter sp.]|nr:chemotaxis protein CheC [Candidatus Elarobacter sp.]